MATPESGGYLEPDAFKDAMATLGPEPRGKGPEKRAPNPVAPTAVPVRAPGLPKEIGGVAQFVGGNRSFWGASNQKGSGNRHFRSVLLSF